MFRGSRRKLWQGCARKWSERNTYFSRSFGAEHKRATTGGRPYGVRTSCAPFRFFCLHAVLFVGTIHELSVWCCGKKRAIRESPLRRQDKLRSVPIFEMKISHMLRCPSFSAKSHVCECLVFINAHIYAFAALPTFHGIYGERSIRREKRVHPLRYIIGRKKA